MESPTVKLISALPGLVDRLRWALRVPMKTDIDTGFSLVNWTGHVAMHPFDRVQDVPGVKTDLTTQLVSVEASNAAVDLTIDVELTPLALERFESLREGPIRAHVNGRLALAMWQQNGQRIANPIDVFVQQRISRDDWCGYLRDLKWTNKRVLEYELPADEELPSEVLSNLGQAESALRRGDLKLGKRSRVGLSARSWHANWSA